MGCNWRIRHKLMLGLGLVMAVTALLLAGALKGLISFRGTMGTIDTKLVELADANKLREAIKALAVPGKNSSTAAAELIERIDEAKVQLNQYHKRVVQTAMEDDDPCFLELNQIKGMRERFDKLDQAVAEAQTPGFSHPGQPQSVGVTHSPEVQTAIDELIHTSGDLNSVIYRRLYERIERSKKDQRFSLGIVVTTSVLGMILMVGLLRFFYCWVFYPIRDLERGVGRVAQGDFEHQIEVNSGDEIEDLAEAYNDMTSRLRDMYRDLNRQVNERSRQLVRSERLASVGFLAAGVAHEINNPLASIAFCSEALERRLADFMQGQSVRLSQSDGQEREIIEKYLKMIGEEAFRCKEITQRLLEFSRGGEMRREPTDLGELTQGVLDMVQHLQNCRGKELVFQQDENIVIGVNAQEIKSVVLNLVVNALDSMDEGGKLTIEQRVHGSMAEIVLEDSGCGMTPETLENIFEPFYTRSRTGKGTGLGLSISHRIITQHGGEIEAVSDGPGQGSTFTVRLPLKPVEEQRSEDEKDRSIMDDAREQIRRAA